MTNLDISPSDDAKQLIQHLEQDNTSYTMMRTFLPQNSKSFSIKEIQDIKAIYLKAIYKTAEKVFHLD